MSPSSNKGQGPTIVAGHLIAATAILLFLALTFRWLFVLSFAALFWWVNAGAMDLFERISYRKGLKKDDPDKSKDRW